MGDPTCAKAKGHFNGEYDYKVDQSDDDSDYDEYDGSAGAYDEYHHHHNENGIREDDQRVVEHKYEEEDMSEVQSAFDVHDSGPADVESEDEHDASSNISEKDEHRLLGAFLLASDGGLDSGGSSDGGEEPRLPMDAPTCLKKFTTIAASLGLKSTREKLMEDFEEVFRRYYAAKIQGELLEVNIRRAWEDLHHGTGGKIYHPGSSASGLGAIDASSMLSGSGKGEAPPNRQQSQHRDSSHGRHGRAYIARAELQKILTTDGEALTDEEVDELLRECRPDEEGRIVYEGYRRMLIDPSL
eukprot:g1243.t1